MEIKRLDDARKRDWDAFVETCPEATFFHRAGWKEVVERAFGHTMPYLFAESAGRIVGVLPLGHIKSFLFGNALISNPFCVYGGAVAESEEARVALEQAGIQLAREFGVDYLELRNRLPRSTGRPTKALYVTFRKDLDPDPERNLSAVPRKQRAMIRKGMAAGLTSVLDRDIERLYDIYAESVRNLGTPVFPKRYFAILKEVFGEDCEILTVEHRGQAVASVMNFIFGTRCCPIMAGDRSGHGT